MFKTGYINSLLYKSKNLKIGGTIYKNWWSFFTHKLKHNGWLFLWIQFSSLHYNNCTYYSHNKCTWRKPLFPANIEYLGDVLDRWLFFKKGFTLKQMFYFMILCLYQLLSAYIDRWRMRFTCPSVMCTIQYHISYFCVWTWSLLRKRIQTI